jgi:hypothetical protein
MTTSYRQGDVLLVRVDEAPGGERIEAEDGRLVLARGEATGHHHSVATSGAELISAAEGVFLRIMSVTPLEHPEHDSIVLEPGIYRVVRQREYEPGALPRQVVD